MRERIATVIGVTGLVGSELLQFLLQDKSFETIRLLVRRPFAHNDPRIESKLIDFSDPESFKLGLEGTSVVFCTVGTTRKKVRGDKTAYRKVDFDIPVNAARYAKEVGANHFILVSAVDASSTSANFYLRLKGEVEEAVSSAGLPCVHIMRPSIILGERKESRPFESIGKLFMRAAAWLMVGAASKYKPIHAKNIAAAMIHACKQNKEGVLVYEYGEMRSMAGERQ